MISQSYAVPLIYPQTNRNESDEVTLVRRKTDALFAEFGAYYTEIDAVRLLVRQTIAPDEVMPGKRIMTVQTAQAFALCLQTRSYFDLATKQYRVLPERNTRAEDKATSKLERWLSGVDDIIMRREGLIKSDAIWHGLESGTMVLGTMFNPYLAAQGKFGIEMWAQDPRGFAWERNRHGLTCAATMDQVTAEAVFYELEGQLQIAKRSSLEIPDWLAQLAHSDPLAAVTIVRYYDRQRE